MSEGPSDNYMHERPHKNIFSLEKQTFILDEMKKWINNNLPQKTSIYKKRIFGSSAQAKFGKYEAKIKGREYSDIDILFVVDDNFNPPKEWTVQFECVKDVWIVYDVAIVPVKTVDETISVEVQFIVLKKTFAEKPETIKEAEKWGIPLRDIDTKNKFISL